MNRKRGETENLIGSKKMLTSTGCVVKTEPRRVKPHDPSGTWQNNATSGEQLASKRTLMNPPNFESVRHLVRGRKVSEPQLRHRGYRFSRVEKFKGVERRNDSVITSIEKERKRKKKKIRRSVRPTRGQFLHIYNLSRRAT